VWADAEKPDPSSAPIRASKAPVIVAAIDVVYAVYGAMSLVGEFDGL